MENSEDFALLDRTHLSAMTAGDTALAAEVLEIFRHQAEVWGRLLSARESNETWADAAHSLKGAALGVGAIKLARLCTKAEALGRSGSATPAAAAVILDSVRASLGETLEAVAIVAHELAGSAEFSVSKDSNS